MHLRADVDRQGHGRFVVRLSGEADLANAHTIADTVQRLLDEPGLGRVEVNLSGVTFLDSAGVRVLLAARRKVVAAGADFLVTHPQDAVAKVLRVLNLETLLGLGTARPD